MDFLRACAARLDAGAPAAEVLEEMRARYTTPRCMNVKTCLVRGMCAPSAEHVAAVRALVVASGGGLAPGASEAGAEGEAGAEASEAGAEASEAGAGASEAGAGASEAGAGSDAVEAVVAAAVRDDRPPPGVDAAAWRALPPRLPDNVRALRIARAEMVECKRLGVRSALKKNRHRLRVDGRALLGAARATVAAAACAETHALALALLLLSGRRTCELFAERSRFEVAGAHALLFGGQAKRRRRAPSSSDAGAAGGADDAYRIPVLCEAPRLVAALAELRARPRRRWQGPDDEEGARPAAACLTENQATSQSLQSHLGRALAAHPVYRAAGRVHALRGIYACMCARLFEWDGDYSDAYVAMGVLGHAGLGESLVYTPVHLGDGFDAEPRLGAASLPARDEDDGAARSPPGGGRA